MRPGRRLVTPDVFDPGTAELTFAISTNDYMQHAVLVPFIEVLRREAAKIRLAIKPLIIAGLVDALARGDADLAVTIPEFAMSNLPSRLLYRERYVAAVRPEHPLAKSPQHLARNLLFLTITSWSRRLADRLKVRRMRHSLGAGGDAPCATPFQASCSSPSCSRSTI